MERKRRMVREALTALPLLGVGAFGSGDGFVRPHARCEVPGCKVCADDVRFVLLGLPASVALGELELAE